MATNRPQNQTNSLHDHIHNKTTSNDENLKTKTDDQEKSSQRDAHDCDHEVKQGGITNQTNKTIQDKDRTTTVKQGTIPKQTNKTTQNNDEKTERNARSEVAAIPQTNFAIGLLVLCCFNLPFGVLALYFSLRAAAAYRDGEKEKGAKRSRLSILCSLFGIMVTMVMVSSVVVYIAVNKHSNRIQRRPNPSALGF